VLINILIFPLFLGVQRHNFHPTFHKKVKKNDKIDPQNDDQDRQFVASPEVEFSYIFNGTELYGHCDPSAFGGKNHL
ncbi:hypothetical protein, partial [uncultured Chryseobacterium sp.]